MLKIEMDKKQGPYDMDDLLAIMRLLRAPDGCPWDREQTHQSIRNNMLEESYEAVDAIDHGDTDALREELGDVLMQLVFHSIMGEEEKVFTFSDIVDELCRKLVFRHPHVFGNATADTTEKVLENWDKLKRVEKSQGTYTDTLKSVPNAFPALMHAAKVEKRAAKAGVCLPDRASALDQVDSSLSVLKTAVEDGDSQAAFGKLLFDVVGAARFCGVDCEEELRRCSDRFIASFEVLEKNVLHDGKKMDELSRGTREALIREL